MTYSRSPDTQRELGQYFTRSEVWKTEPVMNFIQQQSFDYVVDPFAGNGDLLKGFPTSAGYDIDAALGWTVNDSLAGIPTHATALCITNPPYLAKNSAVRRKLANVLPYFENNTYEDLYELALEQCLKAFSNVVAIIPETFITTKYFKDRLVFVDILEDNPFTDTECPVLVACFGPEMKFDFDVFKNGRFVAGWSDILRLSNIGGRPVNLTFNYPDGNIGLIAFDGTSMDNRIRFCAAEEIDRSEIKHTSRARTRMLLITDVPIPEIIERANTILETYRAATSDVALSPFKNNTKNGIRRRRLDFVLARKIIAEALQDAERLRSHPE